MIQWIVVIVVVTAAVVVAVVKIKSAFTCDESANGCPDCPLRNTCSHPH